MTTSLSEGFAKKQIAAIFLQIWGMLIRTSLFQESIKRINILAANRLVLLEDLMQWSSLLPSNFGIIGLDKVGYIYYNNTDSVTRTKSNSTYDYQLKLRIILVYKYLFANMETLFDNFISHPINEYAYKDLKFHSQCNNQVDLIHAQRHVTDVGLYCTLIYN